MSTLLSGTGITLQVGVMFSVQDRSPMWGVPLSGEPHKLAGGAVQAQTCPGWMQKAHLDEDVCMSGFTYRMIQEHTGTEQHRAGLGLGSWGGSSWGW